MPSYTPNLAIRSHLDTQIGILAELTRKSVDTARRLNDLNLGLTRDVLEDYFHLGRQLVASSDPAHLAALLSRQLDPLNGRMRDYAQQLGALLSGAQRDFTRATESLMPETSRAAKLFAAGMPAGSGSEAFPRRGGAA